MAAAAAAATTTRILKDMQELYAGSEGITAIAAELGLSFLPPRRKATIMIIGNHSAGKSSFICWYTGQRSLLRTGVAVESQGFSFVTCGNTLLKEAIKGEGTLRLFPHLSALRDFPGAVDHLQTMVCVKRERMFPLVDFIDTPGLVDGAIEYPFDVNGVIMKLAETADLVLVFMDPIGQALCSRTMDVVQELNRRCPQRLRYFLTKADSIPAGRQLRKVLTQVTQNLTPRVRHTHGFEVPAIYIPRAAAAGSVAGGGRASARDAAPRSAPPDNSIGELCATIEQAVHTKVQDNIDTLRGHCTQLHELLTARAAEEQRRAAARRLPQLLLRCLLFCCLLLPLLHVLLLLWQPAWDDVLPDARHALQVALAAEASVAASLAALLSLSPSALLGRCVCTAATAVVLFLLRWRLRALAAAPAKQVERFRLYTALLGKMQEKCDAMYDEYFHEVLHTGMDMEAEEAKEYM